MISRVAVLLLAATLSLAAADKGLNPQDILGPLGKHWPTFNGDYSGARYSSLKQIDASNVGTLTLAWVLQTRSASIKSMPLVVHGILYFTTPDNVWAADAHTGRIIWHFDRPSKGDHIGNRGVGMWKDTLYFETPDCHLIFIDAKNGKMKKDIQLADPKLGYFATMAPLVIHDHVIVGVSGDVTDIPGFLESLDPVTGKVQWRWWTEPLKKGDPGSDTWPDMGAMRHGGGMTWVTGTYDPELNQLYWGIGNPNPVLAGSGRKGANLYTCSIVSLNPDTGKLNWYFQASPHDTHDWDAVQTPVIINGTVNGAPEKLVAQASRNGYFFVLDRQTGEHVITAPMNSSINWALGIGKNGVPIPNPKKQPSPDGTLVSPSSSGVTNWLAPSYDPQTGLFYVSARRTWSMFYMTATGKPEGWAGRDKGVFTSSSVAAIDYRTGAVRWRHKIGDGFGSAGILTTAGHLLFTADNSDNLLALNPATGETLWHVPLGARMSSAPSTYELDGRQYLLTPAGNVIFAWVLPRTQSKTKVSP
ncbi:MAG: acido-empty-quinoprotein group A [Bryobacteraceae bacterium]